jgi:catechol 2,3-dioxygenase-like lactoylglutathione lyase family enzyme
MTDPNIVILYVADVPASLAFWSALLGRPAVEQTETFALLPLGGGTKLGLWKVGDVEPTATTTGGGTEICFTVGSATEVDATHVDWAARGLAILQAPTEMEFGRTFTAADPDGHRLRVFCPAG